MLQLEHIVISIKCILFNVTHKHICLLPLHLWIMVKHTYAINCNEKAQSKNDQNDKIRSSVFALDLIQVWQNIKRQKPAYIKLYNIKYIHTEFRSHADISGRQK